LATLIVVGQVAQGASLGRGGHAMFILQFLHGLARLRHRVVFVEFLKADPGPAKAGIVRAFDETLTGRWPPELAALVVEPTLESIAGLSCTQVQDVAREASAVVTIGATYRRRPYPIIEGVRPRILFEQDPGYTHVWAAMAHDPADIYGEHDLYFTVGVNVGSERCQLPTCKLPWQPLWNPVILDWWTPAAPVARNAFTTVCDWRSQGFDYFEFRGDILGPKAEEFRKFIDLPRRTGEAFEMAITIDSTDPDVGLLRQHGWRLEPPQRVGTAALYHRFIETARAEFSCAKGGYAGTRSGWFSDRSACYLAAGRPVIVQATGFEDILPTGKGLLAVTNVEEAAEAVRMLRQDYDLHAAAARAVAEEHLDSDKVFTRMLAAAGL
jgi:hypothetical protein